MEASTFTKRARACPLLALLLLAVSGIACANLIDLLEELQPEAWTSRFAPAASLAWGSNHDRPREPDWHLGGRHQDGDVVYRRGFGMGDVAGGKVAHAAAYCCASISKVIGGTLAALLEDEVFTPHGLASMRVQYASDSQVSDYERAVLDDESEPADVPPPGRRPRPEPKSLDPTAWYLTNR